MHICVELYNCTLPSSSGVYPHALGHMNPWLGLSEHAKAWKYPSCQDDTRERGKERERTREREREVKNEPERERDQENTPSLQSRSR